MLNYWKKLAGLQITIKTKAVLLLSITIVGVVGCSLEKLIQDNIVFRGITQTNVFGTAISKDTTDWRVDDQWSKKEASLFSSSYQQNCKPTAKYVVMAYPNPCQDRISLAIILPNTAQIELKIVNSKFEVLVSKENIKSSLMFDTTSWKKKNNDIVRVYYKIIDNGCEFRGHGDIMIE
jgi:hypothetical protein